MWCCKTTEDQCIAEGDDIICNGTAISLSDQCHDENYDGPSCNYYPVDPNRNQYGEWTDTGDWKDVTRSYLDLCLDNRYVQHFKAELTKN